MDVIAERQFLAKFADGRTAPVIVKVSRPFAHPKGDFACTVYAEGLPGWKKPRDTYGIDSWQALMLALHDLRFVMAFAAEHGATFYWAHDPEPVKIDELFKVREVE